MSRSLPIGTLSMVEQFTQRTVVVAPVDELAIWGFDESSRVDFSSHSQTLRHVKASASALWALPVQRCPTVFAATSSFFHRPPPVSRVNRRMAHSTDIASVSRLGKNGASKEEL